MRGKQLELYGYSNYAVPLEVLRERYGELVARALAGTVRVDVERLPLDTLTEAWERQAGGAGRKLVVSP